MDPLIALRILRTACGNQGHAIVLGDAARDARDDFKLHPKSVLLEFIALGRLENPKHINSEPWGNDPDQNNPATVYAFNFSSGEKLGYLAFLLSNQTKKWLIKSFKKDSSEALTALPFQDKLAEFKVKTRDK